MEFSWSLNGLSVISNGVVIQNYHQKKGTVMDINVDIAINANNMGVEWRYKKFKTDNVTTK